jgi:uncharacterized surface protein with fasciclin (FAS1) repeats
MQSRAVVCCATVPPAGLGLAACSSGSSSPSANPTTTAASSISMDSDLTVNQAGGQVDITVGKGDVSHVTMANVEASNGVVHLMSGVLMPPAS